MDRKAPFRWIKDCAIWLSHPYREYDRRRDVRFPADVAVAITVSMGIVEGRSVNLSRGGVSVLMPEAIPCGALVLVRFPMLDRSAFAHVLRCAAREKACEVALQFRDGLMLDDRTMADFDYHRVSADGTWNDPLA
jgi:hypothetical protein